MRSVWKHNFIHLFFFYIIKRIHLNFKNCKNIYLKNRSSFIQKDLLSYLNKSNLFIYNGLRFYLIYCDKYMIGSKLGEFVFTKARGRDIHGLNSKVLKKYSKNLKFRKKLYQLKKQLLRKKDFFGFRVKLKNKKKFFNKKKIKK